VLAPAHNTGNASDGSKEVVLGNDTPKVEDGMRLNLSPTMAYPNPIEHGIMFHHFHDDKHPNSQGSISGEDLALMLSYVGVGRILTPSEWLDKLEKNTLSSEHLCLTFDDALLCQFEIALPVLERYNLKAFWLIYSSVFEGHLEKMELYRFFRTSCFHQVDDFYDLFFRKVFDSAFGTRAHEVLEDKQIQKQIELFPFYSVNDVKFRLIRDRVLNKPNYTYIMDRIISEHGFELSDLSKNLWMSNDHLRYLSNSEHIVGLHSYSHPMVLAQLSYEEQWEEYSRNLSHITQVCGRRPVAMSHPTNSYNDDTVEILGRLGVRCGFRSNMFPKREDDQLNRSRYEIAREDHANILRLMGGSEL
jgi:peptidoglycan/xylan/chitin deacetylase (PgdA/CDA1 family)